MFKKFHNWRKRRIEKLYLKMFPKEEQMVTMNIVRTTPDVRTYYSKVKVDLDTFRMISSFDDMDSSEAWAMIRKRLAWQIGEELLNKHMLTFRINEGEALDFYGRHIYAFVKVVKPNEEKGDIKDELHIWRS